MNGILVYGLMEARRLIAADKRSIGKEFPRSNDPYVRGMRDALKALDDRIHMQIDEYKRAPRKVDDDDRPVGVSGGIA
jgi:hypothetical protein